MDIPEKKQDSVVIQQKYEFNNKILSLLQKIIARLVMFFEVRTKVKLYKFERRVWLGYLYYIVRIKRLSLKSNQ